jgi:hypothetical protein
METAPTIVKVFHSMFDYKRVGLMGWHVDAGKQKGYG